jgi:hypothetical protein
MWIGAWAWEEHFLPYFADNGYRALALGLSSHAGSEGPADVRWCSIEDYVADGEQVVDQPGTPPVIIGISMGGFISHVSRVLGFTTYIFSHRAARPGNSPIGPIFSLHCGSESMNCLP